MRRIGTTLAAVAAILALTAGTSMAAPVGTLDQQQTTQTDGKYWSSDYHLAQSFEAGIAGTLTTVTHRARQSQPIG